jgi:hypothetical protein
MRSEMKTLARTCLWTMAMVVSISRLVWAETPIGAATISLVVSPQDANCPSEAELAKRVESELSGPNKSGRSAQVSVRVFIELHATDFVAQVEVLGQPLAHRQLHAPSCDSLGDALVVAIAMVLDAQAARAASPNDPAEVASDQPKETSKGSASHAANHLGSQSGQILSAVPLPPDPPMRGALRIIAPASVAVRTPEKAHPSWGLWVSGGASSSLSMLLSAGGELRWRQLTTRLGAFLEDPKDFALGPGEVSRVRVGGLGAACLGWGRASRILACGQAWLGSESYEGHKYAHYRSDRVFSGALGPSLGVETGQGLTLGLDVVGIVDVWQYRYVAPVSGNDYRPNPVALWLLLRIGLSNWFGTVAPN